MKLEWTYTNINKNLPETDSCGWSKPCLIWVIDDKKGKSFIPEAVYFLNKESDYNYESDTWIPKWCDYVSHGEYADDFSLDKVVAYVLLDKIEAPKYVIPDYMGYTD